MANEIKVVSVSNGGDSTRFNLLLYYAIPAGQRITDPLTSSPFVVTPTSGLGAEELSLLSASEKTALDAGQALVVSESITFLNAISAQEMLAEVQAHYADRQAAILATYISKYTHAHKQFNAA